MEQLKISEKNKIRNEIKILENLLNRNKGTIDRLSNSNSNIEFNKKQIEKLILINTESETKILCLKERYEDLNGDKLNNELKEKILQANKDILKRKEKNDKKINEKNEQKKEDKEYLDLEYRNRKKSGMSDFSIQKETDRYFKNSYSLPPNKLNNLKNMPNNKGYIWNNIWHLGLLPQDSDTIILFEQIRNSDIQKIHEYTNEYYSIYHKTRNDKKQKLISREKRNPILSIDELNKIKFMAIY